MAQIPTAEVFMADWSLENGNFIKGDAIDAAILFAKAHVKAALEAAAENARAKENPQDYGTGEIWVDKESILSAYPESNIK